MNIEVAKKSVTSTGIASLGWQLGYGYRQEKMTIKRDRWCVLKNGKIIAECRSEKAAEEIADAFAWVGHTG